MHASSPAANRFHLRLGFNDNLRAPGAESSQISDLMKPDLAATVRSHLDLPQGGFDERTDSVGRVRRVHRHTRGVQHADRGGQSADQAMQRFTLEDAGALVLASDRRTKVLVCRQDRDREIIAALARSGACASKCCSSEGY